MKILSIDTASNICGVSILENKDLICNLDEDTGRTHSENLMFMIKKAFENTGLTLSDIDLIVCDKGPGSFTGIRIGVATVKAFVDCLNIPCIGVDSLTALAYNAKLAYGNNYTGFICTMIDCKNENCYFALYSFENGICNCLIQPCADSVQNAINISKQEIYKHKTCNQKLNKNKKRNSNNINEFCTLFIGDATFTNHNIIEKNFSNYAFIEDTYNQLNSHSLALAGFELFNNNSDLLNEQLLPLYLKKPQAQRQLEAKLLKNNI